jgi:cytochrome c551/c552
MKPNIFFSTVAVLLFMNASANTTTVNDGKIIFSSRCAACHNVNVKIVGPALANVDQRHSLDWIVKFVHSSQTLVKGNDKEAIALFNEFNQMIMPDHPDLSGDQVKSIVEYIKSQTRAPSASDGAPFVRPGKLLPNYLPMSITNYAFFGTYLALVLIMIAGFVIAVKVKEMQRGRR